MFDFLGGPGGGCWADAITGTELGRSASPGGDVGGIGWLTFAGD